MILVADAFAPVIAAAHVAADAADRYPVAIAWGLLVTGAVLALHALGSLLAGRRAPRRGCGLLGGASYTVAALAVAGLAATAFAGVLRTGAMHGWVLWGHTVAAGAFVVALPLTALLWGPRNLPGHRPPAATGPGTNSGSSPAPAIAFSPLSKLAYWLVLLTGWATLATMVPNMMPWLGTPDLLRMIELHRWAGLGLTLVTACHAYLILMGRLGR